MTIVATFATLALTLAAVSDLRTQTADLLEGRLAAAEQAPSPERRGALLREAGREAADDLGSARTADLLRRAVEASRWKSALGDARADEALARDLAELASDLRFRPRIEADLPAGFPLPTPVHEIEVKRYPAYRMASAPSRGQNAFWTLFQHIEKHEIAMTAPVEMTYSDEGEALRETRMAFLYATPEMGTAGPDERVEVQDIPTMEVVSLGCRGNASGSRIAEGRALLAAWLADHPELEAAGPLRTFGYNSPMVRGNRRTFEVQLPVRPVAER